MNPSDCGEIVTTKEGFGAMEPQTAIDVFLETLAAHPKEPALCYKRKAVSVSVIHKRVIPNQSVLCRVANL